jgi:hypothetical protein
VAMAAARSARLMSLRLTTLSMSGSGHANAPGFGGGILPC